MNCLATLVFTNRARNRIVPAMRIRYALQRIRRSLARARLGIITVAIAYLLGLLSGGIMVHAGNQFALGYRDRLVGKAQKESPILAQSQKGHHLAAASLDAGGNAAAGLASLLAGYCVPAGYWIALQRGWVGGVVSVDGAHRSRLSTRYEAFYYFTTLALQLIPYTLAGGAGVNLGFAAFGKPSWTGYHGARVRFLRIPYQALRDAAWIYLFTLPFFAFASWFEFTM